MTVDFLHYNSCVLWPIAVGGSDIDQVSIFKPLGVHLSEDLTFAVNPVISQVWIKTLERTLWQQVVYIVMF